MNFEFDNPYQSHERLFLLLPWYVNKSLESEELQAVEQHLKVCLTCRREVAQQQLLAKHIQHADRFDSATEASFARLQSRLHPKQSEVESWSPQAEKLSTADQIKAKRRFFSVPLMALAASLAIALVLPLWGKLNSSFSPQYKTLSNKELGPQFRGALKVIFKAQTSTAAIQSILHSIDGQLLDGPDAQSIYTIGFGATNDKQQILSKLAQLRQNEQVVFAEPADDLLSEYPVRNLD